MHNLPTNFAKTLVLKHEYDVKLWRHKERKPDKWPPCATEWKPPHEYFLYKPLEMLSLYAELQ